jgi:DNA-binding transcriptional ArsR family regulator
MVESTMQLDFIFGALASPIRRDILRRAAKRERSIGELAEPFNLTFAAISKHLKVLEKAKLIVKKRRGKELVVQLSKPAFDDAAGYLMQYEKLWNQRLDSLESYLSTFPK